MKERNKYWNHDSVNNRKQERKFNKMPNPIIAFSLHFLPFSQPITEKLFWEAYVTKPPCKQTMKVQKLTCCLNILQSKKKLNSDIRTRYFSITNNC